MNREEYLSRAHEFAQRGERHPRAVLTETVVKELRQAGQKRAQIRGWIRDNLSDEALCTRLGLHRRTLWTYRDLIPEIKDARKKREELYKYLAENLTNDALSAKYKLHPNTVDKVINRGRWAHVDEERRVVPREPSLETVQSPSRRAT